MGIAAVFTSSVADAATAARRPSEPAAASSGGPARTPIDYDHYRAEARRLRVAAIRSTVPIVRAWLRGLRST